MKIQCSCGAKYAFDLTPEMLREPVKFICPQCGRDSSDFVNELIRQEVAEQNVPPVPPPPAVAAPPPRPAPARLKIAREEAAPAPAAAPEAPAENYVSKFCSKHRGVPVTEKCVTCGKPICPQCMEMFGYFCSPLCKGKAELQGIAAPAYAGQRFAVEKRFWRETGLIFGSLCAAAALFLAAWIWYAWFGSVPHVAFSVRFADDDRAYAGNSQTVGADQIVFLHGGTLARYDLKTRKPVWSRELISPDQINAIVKAEDEERARENANSSGDERVSVPLPGAEQREARIALQNTLTLHVFGQNIWVSQDDKLVHYSWDSGQVAQEIPLPPFGGEMAAGGDELLFSDGNTITHVNPATGETRVENLSEAAATTVASSAGGPGRTGGAADNGGGGLGSTDGRPLDPNKVASEAQNLKLQGRIALPALLANAAYEQRLEEALRDTDPNRPNKTAAQLPPENTVLIHGLNDFWLLDVKMLRQNFVTREAMRAAPAKSALDNPNLNASQTTSVANEILNEMQRNNGNDKVTEDDSLYQVTVHAPNAPDIADWQGQVTGPPQLICLKTVNVIAAGKTIIVLDQANKKLWDATLTYSLPYDGFDVPGEKSKFGAGPCVEQGQTLYVFDQAVLTAFDLATGNARWRVPTVGVVGLFFDDAGHVYVNTTTGNPDDIKYSRQIDIAKSTQAVLMKLDASTGKTLWTVKPGGFVSYVSGEFIYTIQSYDPNPQDTEVLSDTLSGLQLPPFMRITRLSPKDGHVLWYHQDDRCPVNVRFDQNTIELVFKREVQVLKYLVL